MSLVLVSPKSLLNEMLETMELHAKLRPHAEIISRPRRGLRLITLADELRGIPVRRPMTGIKRRLFCVDENTDVKAELRRLRVRIYGRKYRLEHREEIRARDKLRRAAKKALIAKQQRAWRLKNIEHVRAYRAQKRREWRRAHPEKVAEANRLYRQKNKARLAAKERAYRQANREAVNARQRARHAKKKRAAMLALKEAA